MSPLLSVALAALGGGVGAVGRHAVRGLGVRGTLLVNLVGSFLLGVLLAVAPRPEVAVLLGAGVLGGLTTFSTASLDTVTLARRDRTLALGHAVGTAVGALAAAALGWWVASQVI